MNNAANTVTTKDRWNRNVYTTTSLVGGNKIVAIESVKMNHSPYVNRLSRHRKTTVYRPMTREDALADPLWALLGGAGDLEDMWVQVSSYGEWI